MLISESFQDEADLRFQKRSAANANFYHFAYEVAEAAKALRKYMGDMWQHYAEQFDPEDKMPGEVDRDLNDELDELVKTKEIVGELNYEPGWDMAQDWMARHRKELEAIFSKYYNENTKY